MNYSDYRKMIGPDPVVPDFQDEADREEFLRTLGARILAQKKEASRKNLDERYRHCLILALIGLLRLRNKVAAHYRDMGPL